MKPKICKVGNAWIVWVPGVRVYRFLSWDKALECALNAESRR